MTIEREAMRALAMKHGSSSATRRLG